MVVVFVVVAVLVTSAFAPKRYMTFGIGTSSGCNKSRGVSNLFGDEANSTYLIIDCMLMPLVSPHRGISMMKKILVHQLQYYWLRK